MVLNVIVNSSGQGTHIGERSTAQPFISNLLEPAFYHIESGTRHGGEVQMESRMALQPRLNAGMLMRSIVVHDQVQAQTLRGLGIDAFEKANEFLMLMAGHAVADDLTLKHVQGGEDSGRAVVLVIVGLTGRQARAQRQ